MDQWYTFPLTKQAQFQGILVVDGHNGSMNVAEAGARRTEAE
ncbi:MAG TPA: hypothetical protein VN133_12740 [Humibacter sp.]|nr:hypothetical protein [Humibacter sp.]